MNRICHPNSIRILAINQSTVQSWEGDLENAATIASMNGQKPQVQLDNACKIQWGELLAGDTPIFRIRRKKHWWIWNERDKRVAIILPPHLVSHSARNTIPGCLEPYALFFALFWQEMVIIERNLKSTDIECTWKNNIFFILMLYFIWYEYNKG